MSYAAIALAYAVATWLALTVAAQFRSLALWIAPYDPVRLLPTWTFFAPTPGMFDYHIAVRDCSANGSLTPWLSVYPVPKRNWANFLWNPGKRSRKILIDAVQSMMWTMRAQGHEAGHEILSIPYLVLLNIAVAAERSTQATHRQFALIQSSGHNERPITVLYVSQFHSLADRVSDVAK